VRNKGVVVEIAPEGKVIIMTSGGEFREVPFRKHVHVGQEIRYSPRKKRLNIWQLGLAATLFLALVGTWPLLTEKLVPGEAAFVLTLDLNPSLELQISTKQRVLAAEGLNRDGKEFLAHLDITGLELEPALAQITAEARKRGHLKQGRDHVFVTVAALDGEKPTARVKMAEADQYNDLEQTVHDAFRTIGSAQVKIWRVPRKLQTEAKLAGITPGRYVVIQAPLQRIETRLTMRDAQPTKQAAAIPIGERNQPRQISLKPAERAQASLTAMRVAGALDVDFGAGSGKGDFRFYE